jgi:hypothetical protein
MRNEPISLVGRTSLTRISVSGSGDHFLVRNGSEQPVRVLVRRDGLECECGKAACAHIATLEMCGFVEPAYKANKAA